MNNFIKQLDLKQETNCGSKFIDDYYVWVWI